MNLALALLYMMHTKTVVCVYRLMKTTCKILKWHVLDCWKYLKCVRMFVCMFVCVCVCVCVHARMCVHGCVCICLYVLVFIINSLCFIA